ncbi:MAG: DUF438 domain-containing protein [archaeon]|nr:DUF438 domain-containing protein [archaeon]MCP8306180.1 DUF438 domain-containing protein [archaeon]
MKFDKLNENKKELLKELIRQLHAGASPQEVKERFKRVLEGVSPMEIAKIEGERRLLDWKSSFNFSNSSQNQ